MRKILAAVVIASFAIIGLGVAPATSAVKITVTAAPAINKFATVGTKVAATLAKITPKPSKATLEWLYNGKAIAKATATTYKIPASQAAGKLQLRETAVIGTAKKVVLSNIIEIGQLFVVANPQLAYTDGTNTTLAITAAQVLPAPVSIGYAFARGTETLYNPDNSLTHTISLADAGTQIAASAKIKAPAGYADIVLKSPALTIASTQRVYAQVWSDEFSGASGATANAANWVGEDGDGVAYGNRGWGNNERQWYKFDQSTTNGSGILNLTATSIDAANTHCYYGACEFLSSKLVTKGKVGFTYGRLEARIKAAPGQGTWNAFWTLGTDIDTVYWPMCGEIDVMEILGSRPSSLLGYLHGPISNGMGRGNTKDGSSALTADFHTYTIDWLPDQVTWYVDGVKYGSVSKTDRDWVFNHEFYVILNLAMGGNLGGTIDPTLTSTTMQVDYVRYSTINGIGTLHLYPQG